MAATAERRYKLTRIRSGDYVFPSNDARTLWRIFRYEEDGAPFWATARFDGTVDDAEELLNRNREEFVSWNRWETWEATLKTRRDAINAAMEAATTPEP